MRALLVLFVGTALLAAPLGAQAPVPRSELTGATLIVGATADRGIMARAGARLRMMNAARSAGQNTTDDVEKFKLPPALGAAAADSVLVSIQAQGWTVTLQPQQRGSTDVWGFMTRADGSAPTFLVYLQRDPKQSNVYFAKSAGAIVAAAAQTPSAAPAATIPPPVATEATPAYVPPPAPAAAPTTPAPAPAPANVAAPITVPSTWAITTTDFSDGWKAFDEPDWVRGVKGSITARVHHASFNLTSFVNQDGEQYVWNTLVAPRYRDIGNLWVRKPWWEDGGKSFVSAEGTETASGTRYYIVLFRNGNGARWIEYLAPDKATFEREMGITVQVQGGTNWGALAREGLNRFAVSAADLPGVWGSSSAAGVSYVSTITGQSMGMATVSSVYRFTFRNDGSYDMRYVGAGGMAGNQRFGSEDWAGRVVMNGQWKMSLTGAFKGATYEHDVWFEAIGGGMRALALQRNGTVTRVVRETK